VVVVLPTPPLLLMMGTVRIMRKADLREGPAIIDTGE
jgi:hypothetical protein